MGWLIALVVLILLAILPLGVSALYDYGGPMVSVIAGPVRIKLYSGKKKEKKQKAKPAKDKAASPPVKQKEKEKKKSGGSIRDFFPLVKTALVFLGDFRRKLRVDRLEVNCVLAGDDPCDLAVLHGKVWTALGNLMPQLERIFVIKKRNIQLSCDFMADKTVIFARLDITITLGRLLYLVFRYGIRALREYLNIMKTRKGGAKS